MRISTSMIYDTGVGAIQKKTTDVMNVQQQLSLQRRILTPSDDPVAAAQALQVSQSISVNDQFQSNQQNVKDALALSESQLRSANDILIEVHTLTVQLGNATLSPSDRKSIAGQLRQDFSQLMSIANTQDGTGNYLYSGFRGETQPFTGSVELGVVYNGDDGQRELPVTATHSLAISDSGRSIFLAGADASVPFATAADPLNKGGASIGTATVTDASKWNAATNDKNYTIKFAVVGAATTYDIVDTQGKSLLTNAPASSTPPLPATYVSAPGGTAIPLVSQVMGGPDLGASVTITGAPSNGDTFTIRPSAPASVFNTIGDIIKAAETGGATFNTSVDTALANISAAQDNLLTRTADIGCRMNEADALLSKSSQMKIDYTATLSRLQDVDYASAISSYQQNLLSLQAAQQSFTKVTQLSLFNYL